MDAQRIAPPTLRLAMSARQERSWNYRVRKKKRLILEVSYYIIMVL